VTGNGLPRRVRQASLAAPLRAGPPPPRADALAGRTPEQVRRMMSSYQRGTAKGREEAAVPVSKPQASEQNRDEDSSADR
jgi:hypothetical protein